ncbi:MAG: helix-turn-helix domain-containing protein [Acidimicrobiales bacterium]
MSALPNDLPAFLTIEEAAALLRIGRTTAYLQARIYRQTNGREGLPNVSLGRRKLVPLSDLLHLLDRDSAVN